MEANVFIDIETIPVQSQSARDEIKAQITPPGNIKKPESVEKWLAENAADAATDQINKTSFDPAQGHICTIAWAIDDGPVWSLHADTVEEEAGVLWNFFASLREFRRTTFIGHNVGAFDMRFLLCRAVVLGVTVPRVIPRDPKPWDTTIFDTMLAWAGQRGTISLDRLCKALGVEGKDGFDGSQVAAAWEAGEHERIEAYCKDDVRRVREVWRKFDAAGLT